MIYLKNTEEPQKIQIPRKGEVTVENKEFKLQEKTLTIDRKGEFHIVPDKGYNGITKLTITIV